MEPRTQRIIAPVIDTVLRHRLAIIPLVVLLAAAAWPLAEQLEFDQSIESLYARNDPNFSAYAESKSLFGGDEFAITAWRESGLLDPDTQQITESGRDHIKSVVGAVSEVPGVDPGSIQDLVDATAIASRIGEQETAIRLSEGMLIGIDHETTAVVARLLPEGDSPVSRGETVARIRNIAKANNPRAFVVGEPVQIHDMFRLVEEDGHTLFLVSLALLAIVLFLLFRSLKWVLLPLILVVLTIRWTEAVLVLTDTKLSMVSSMMNSLVTIIGVASATHLAVGFRERRQSMDRSQALRQTIVELAPPIFWTCGTTAVGFAALLSSQITPVRSFGLMMTLATSLFFIVLIVVMPAGMATRRPGGEDRSDEDPDRRSSRLDLLIGDPAPAPAERQLVSILRGTTGLIRSRPSVIAGIAFSIVLLAAVGLTRLRVETDFSRNFRDTSELVQSLNFVESNLGGAGTWEVNFPAPQPLTKPFIDNVRELADSLKAELVPPRGDSPKATVVDGRLSKVVALTDGLDLIPEEVGVAFLKKTFTIDERLTILRGLQPEVVAGLYNPEQNRMRLLLRGRERQKSAAKLELIARVGEISTRVLRDDDESDGDDVPVTTGLFVLLTFLIESLLRDQVVSFVIAATGIGLMMSVAFRSITIGLASLIPNLFPIVLVIGGMGWLNLPINIATAMIASVSMGLTVDNSIHYLSAYQRARRSGCTVSVALEQTQTHVGRALVFSNVALVAGFSVLTLSHFIPLVYFGLLVSVAMLGGLAGNLFLLPLLLQKLDKDTSVESPLVDDESAGNE